MRKTLNALLGIAVLSCGLASCNGTGSSSETAAFDTSKTVTAYTRDTTSGTRDGFCTKIGIEAAKSKDNLLTKGVAQTTGNGDMMTKVGNDEYGIGYSSLSALSENNKIKALTVEGVEATNETVVDGSYKLQRNFNMAYVTADSNATEQALVNSFIDFLHSIDGQSIVTANGGIIDPANGTASNKTFDGMVKEGGTGNWVSVLGYTAASMTTDVSNVEINFVGSTSVEDMSKALTDGWIAKFPKGNQPKAVHNHTGSGDAIKKLDDGTGHIGFASRDFTADEQSGEKHETYKFEEICKDAICPIVNVENPLEDISIQELRDIYVNPDAIKDAATSNENFGADYSSETPITTWSQLID